MSSLYALRGVDLGELAPKLAPFIAAYRPHGEVPKCNELKEAGYVIVAKESFVDELEEVYFLNHGYYPDEKDENVQGDSGA